MPHLSIVTCTRSPDPALLSRVLAAVRALTVPEGWTRDYLLIDSASPEPLDRVSVVAEFLAAANTGTGWSKVLRASEPEIGRAHV